MFFSNSNSTLPVLLILVLSCLSRFCVFSNEITRQQNHIRHHNHHRTPYEYNEASLGDPKNPLISCPSCFLRLEQLKFLDSDNIRLEAIKQQILLKLGLKSKPNVTHTVSRKVILDTLSRYESDVFVERQHNFKEKNTSQLELENLEVGEESLTSETEEGHHEPSKIISFSEKGGSMNGNQILEFSISNELSKEQEMTISSAFLWLKIDRTQDDDAGHTDHVHSKEDNYLFCKPKLWIFKIRRYLEPKNYTERVSSNVFEQMTELETSKSLDLDSDLGWQKFNLTNGLREWYRHYDQSKLKILIDCSGCCDRIHVHRFQSKDTQNNNKNRPYIVIEAKPLTSRRKRRRAIDCNSAVKGQCCKQKFYVNFKQLGWDDWVIAPAGYYANYCRGDCDEHHRTPDMFLNYYTHVIEEIRKKHELSGMQPCCAPIKFSSMSLIYFGPDNNIIKRDLPKMVVEECGCP